MTQVELREFDGRLVSTVYVEGTPDCVLYGTQVYRKSTVENTYLLVPNYIGAQAVMIPSDTIVTGESSEDPILTNLEPIPSWLG